MSTIFNRLSIKGDPDHCDFVRETLGRPTMVAVHQHSPGGLDTPKYLEVERPVLSLYNIVKPSLGGEAEYLSTWAMTKMWNLSNWGVQSDVANPVLESRSPGSVVYRFETPTNSPGAALVLLSSTFPLLKFTLDSTQESAGGARFLIENGVHTTTDMWTAPATHRGYERVRGPLTCPCHTMSPLRLKWRPAYFDCPGGHVETNLAVALMTEASEKLSKVEGEWRTRA